MQLNNLSPRELEHLSDAPQYWLDVFNKIYSVEFDAGNFDSEINVRYLKLSANEYFYLTHITASYGGDSGDFVSASEKQPFVKFTDVASGKVLNTADVSLNSGVGGKNDFIPVGTTFAPGAEGVTTNPANSKGLTIFTQLEHLFPPEGQIKIEAYANAAVNNPTLKVAFHGFVIRIGKV